MAYSKQNFQDGQILNAANLEAMENGIIAGQGAHNLLDNSDFTNLVNSRGKSSYSTDGNEYTIDRWKTQYGTGLTIENGYINIIGAWQIYQTLKNPKDGVYTFAAEIRINSIGDYQPNMYISDGTEVLLDAPIGQWKTYILQYDLSSIESDNISFSLCARGGNNSNASISARWAAMYKGAYDASTLPPYVPKGKHVEMLNCGISFSPHNLLDNSDFRNSVNQRGIASGAVITGWDYFIDRWKARAENCSVSFSEEGITVSTPIGQTLPKETVKNGMTVTAAAKWSDGTICVASGVIRRTNEWGSFSSANINGHSLYVSDEGNGNNACMTISEGTVVWAALYEGSYDASTLPAYQPKGYAAELAECQRYYVHCGEGSWMTGFFKVGEGLVVEIPVADNIRTPYPTIIVNSPKIFTTNGWYNITYSSCAVTKCWTKLLFNIPEEANPYITNGSVYIITGIVGVSADL